MKLKFILNAKQQWEVKQQTSNWLDLPHDVMANILYKVGVSDILKNAQKVCTTWHKICKDPAIWRVINMENIFDNRNRNGRSVIQEMCKHAVDRSQGHLVDITICDFVNEELLEYIANRSSQLRRLEFAGGDIKNWVASLKKFPLLEELSLYLTNISHGAIITAGRCCPRLSTLKINYEQGRRFSNGIAFAIGQNLPELNHLELIRQIMSYTGLQAILDGCRHLELLDLHHCYCLRINLKGDFGKKNIFRKD